MKHMIALLLVLCMCVPFTGCAGLSRELSEREFCEAVAVDYAQGVYTFSALCFNLAYGNDNQDQPKYKLFTGEGNDLNAALDDLEDLAQKALSFDKLSAAVLGRSVDWQFAEIVDTLSAIFYTNCGASVFLTESGESLLTSIADKDIDFTEFVRLCEDPDSGGETLGFPLYEISNGIREGAVILPYIEIEGELLSATALAACSDTKSRLIADPALMEAILLVKNRTNKLRVDLDVGERSVTAWLIDPRVRVSYDRQLKAYYVACSARLVTSDTVRQRARTDADYRAALERQGERALQEYFLLAVRQGAQQYGVILLDRSYYESVYAPGARASSVITVRTGIRAVN